MPSLTCATETWVMPTVPHCTKLCSLRDRHRAASEQSLNERAKENVPNKSVFRVARCSCFSRGMHMNVCASLLVYCRMRLKTGNLEFVDVSCWRKTVVCPSFILGRCSLLGEDIEE